MSDQRRSDLARSYWLDMFGQDMIMEFARVGEPPEAWEPGRMYDELVRELAHLP